MFKKCNKCNWVKPLSEFYKHKTTKDGRLGKCKECAKSLSRKNRADNIEYYKSYDRGRAKNTDRVEARKRYAASEEGKKSSNKAKKSWTKRNPIKRKVINQVNNAIRDGKLLKPNKCESCGCDSRIEGHHNDYAKPLDVGWLCSACHRAWHKVNGEGKNSNVQI